MAHRARQPSLAGSGVGQWRQQRIGASQRNAGQSARSQRYNDILRIELNRFAVGGGVCRRESGSLPNPHAYILYVKTLDKDWNIEHIPFAKRPKKLPLVLSQDEVRAVLEAITDPQNRLIAMTLYAAGLRVSEAVSLRIADIDSKRMMIHVVQGKGRKDRLVTLSPLLLQNLRCHVRRYRPRSWLFPSRQYRDRHVTRDTVAHAITAVRHVVVGKPVTRIPCATVSPPICWNPAPICAPSRRCSDMPRSRAP